MKSSTLLINEAPLVLQPSLAMAVGLNEALILQQVQYWLTTNSGVIHEGRKWIFNTIGQWRKQMPFWSEDTIKRALKNLRDSGILETANLAEDSRDRTLYYTINYDVLNNCIGGDSQNASVQIAPMEQGSKPSSSKTETTNREYPLSPPGGEVQDEPAVIATAKRSAKRKPSTALPEGWTPSPEDREAIGNEFPAADVAWLKSETQKFRDHARANDVRHVEWGRAWRNWIRTAHERKPQRPGAGNSGLSRVPLQPAGTPYRIETPSEEGQREELEREVLLSRTMRQRVLDELPIPYGTDSILRWDSILRNLGEPGLLEPDMPLPRHSEDHFIWSTEKGGYARVS